MIAVAGARLYGSEAPVEKTLAHSGPKIHFEKPIQDIGRVKAGESIQCVFWFTNAGPQPLELTAIRPNCGCTVPGQWSRNVASGATGQISVQLSVASNWPSGPTEKTVLVDSNDPTQPASILTIKAFVSKAIDVIPEHAVLKIPAESPSPVSAILEITNNINEPLQLFAAMVSRPSFTVQLETNRIGQEFRLTVTAHPPFTVGTVEGQIKVKTSSRAMPEIIVNAIALVQPSLVVMPPQITLSSAPLRAQATPTITIRNNASEAVTLSELIVNVPGVSVEKKELEPGHLFAIKLIFPRSFKLPKGKQCELSIRTSHSRFPLIKVPIAQMAP